MYNYRPIIWLLVFLIRKVESECSGMFVPLNAFN